MRLLLERKHCKQWERTFSELAPNKARPLWDDAGISYLRSGKGSVGREVLQCKSCVLVA